MGIIKKINIDTLITSLSGGERQSSQTARAMYFEADLIILYKPTNNLGIEEREGVLRFICEVKDAGRSRIFITHNIYHVFQVVHRIILMRRGKVVGDVVGHTSRWMKWSV